MIASLSGIRGIPGFDLGVSDVARFSRNFAQASGAGEVLVARDTRRTGPELCKAISSGVLAAGGDVLDFGVISTPALFRESRWRRRPAVMVTASHNEPEFNGLKFVVDGAGIGRGVLERVLAPRELGSPVGGGSYRNIARPTYVQDLVSRFGKGSCEGVKVAMDLGGGAAISHAVDLFGKLGCSVLPINDSYGVFARTVDPVADDLGTLRKMVLREKCDIGLGFDCDGDRLVVVDPAGRKRTGDFMLTLALSEMLDETRERKVVVSVDTTGAVDEVAKRRGAQVARSKVGEANVVDAMRSGGARLGGEGSSGGLIDAEFNFCRDSLLAAVVIARALKREGRRVFRSVPSYHQQRVALKMSRTRAQRAIQRLAKKYPSADMTDGLKLSLSAKSWVLIRPSETEEVVRVSAEAQTIVAARRAAAKFASIMKETSG